MTKSSSSGSGSADAGTNEPMQDSHPGVPAGADPPMLGPRDKDVDLTKRKAVRERPSEIREIIPTTLQIGPTSTLEEWSDCSGQIEKQPSVLLLESYMSDGGMLLLTP